MSKSVEDLAVENVKASDCSPQDSADSEALKHSLEHSRKRRVAFVDNDGEGVISPPPSKSKDAEDKLSLNLSGFSEEEVGQLLQERQYLHFKLCKKCRESVKEAKPETYLFKLAGTPTFFELHLKMCRECTKGNIGLSQQYSSMCMDAERANVLPATPRNLLLNKDGEYFGNPKDNRVIRFHMDIMIRQCAACKAQQSTIKHCLEPLPQSVGSALTHKLRLIQCPRCVTTARNFAQEIIDRFPFEK